MSEKYYPTEQMIAIVGNAPTCGELIAKYKAHIKLVKQLNKMAKSKTPTKKKAVKKKVKINKPESHEFTIVGRTSGSIRVSTSPYELFQSRNGTWKWRKRAKNRAILNHQYNTKAAAIKGMKADYAVTVAMESFEFREVKG